MNGVIICLFRKVKVLFFVCMEVHTLSWQVKSLRSFNTFVLTHPYGCMEPFYTYTPLMREAPGVLQLKQKLQQSQQRAALCSRTADEAEGSRREAEKSRALAEARALRCQRDKEEVESDQRNLSEELQLLKQEVHVLHISCS